MLLLPRFQYQYIPGKERRVDAVSNIYAHARHDADAEDNAMQNGIMRVKQPSSQRPTKVSAWNASMQTKFRVNDPTTSCREMLTDTVQSLAPDFSMKQYVRQYHSESGSRSGRLR